MSGQCKRCKSPHYDVGAGYCESCLGHFHRSAVAKRTEAEYRAKYEDRGEPDPDVPSDVLWITAELLFEVATKETASEFKDNYVNVDHDDGLFDWIRNGILPHVHLAGTFEVNVTEVTSLDLNPILAVHVCE